MEFEGAIHHFHLVVETPGANLGQFMQGVLTGYGIYYNRRHRSHVHVTQGRYAARLVEGNEYLLKLSRYVHLNPVKTAAEKSKSLGERVERLRKCLWSSYPSYAGLAPENAEATAAKRLLQEELKGGVAAPPKSGRAAEQKADADL